MQPGPLDERGPSTFEILERRLAPTSIGGGRELRQRLESPREGREVGPPEALAGVALAAIASGAAGTASLRRQARIGTG